MVQQEKIHLQYGTYVGQVHGGKPNGDGQMHFHGDDVIGRKIYQGQWANGRRTGQGKMTWNTGEEFIGDWKDNLQQGQGEHRWASSGHYDVCGWDQGLRHGNAVYYDDKGNQEEATYVEGYENGPSIVHFAK